MTVRLPATSSRGPRTIRSPRAAGLPARGRPSGPPGATRRARVSEPSPTVQTYLDPLRGRGAKPPHLDRIVRVWLSGQRVAEQANRDRLRLPHVVQQELPGLDTALDAIVRVIARQAAEDGSERLLLELEDGLRVESVRLPGQGLCVSTQVGCAVGCTFCETGTLGLTRNLTTPELLAQVVLARRSGPVRRVVFMGMGEPAHNLESVLAAVTELGLRGAIGHKELVFSTVGEPSVFERLAANEVRPALALSLHTTDARRRAELLPRAPRVAPEPLLAAALAYAEESGHPLRIQWTLLAGVNDTDEELAQLASWLEGQRAVVDFIDYNPVEAFDHERTSWERTHQLTRALHARGIKAKHRSSAGQAVRGGCGQLSALLERR